MHLDSLAIAGAVGISRAKNQCRWCLFDRKMSSEKSCAQMRPTTKASEKCGGKAASP